MIAIDIICVGKLSKDFLKNGCQEYFKRIDHFCKLNVIEIDEERLSDSPSENEIQSALKKEGEKIKKKFSSGSYIIALCIEGTEMTSELFAKKLNDIQNTYSKIIFIIGSSYGLADEIKSDANCKLSFGKITLPHQLARLVLSEQIYRAFTINNNMKYHK